MKTYCVKEKKETECIQPDGYKIAKNGRRMYWCTCASCGIKKHRFVANEGGTKASKPKPKKSKKSKSGN